VGARTRARTQKYRFGLSWPSCLFSGRIFQFTIRLPVNQTSSADCVCMCAHACTKIQIWIKLAFLPFLWKNFSIHNQTSSESDFQCRLCVCVCVCVCVQKYRFGLSWPSCLFSGRIFQFTIRLPVQIIVTEKGAETCCYSESSFLFFFNQ